MSRNRKKLQHEPNFVYIQDNFSMANSFIYYLATAKGSE